MTTTQQILSTHTAVTEEFFAAICAAAELEETCDCQGVYGYDDDADECDYDEDEE